MDSEISHLESCSLNVSNLFCFHVFHSVSVSTDIYLFLFIGDEGTEVLEKRERSINLSSSQQEEEDVTSQGEKFIFAFHRKYVSSYSILQKNHIQ